MMPFNHPSVSLIDLLKRSSTPVAAFGITVLMVTSITAFLVSPNRYPLRIGETSITIGELETQKNDLLKRKELIEERKKQTEKTMKSTIGTIQMIQDTSPLIMIVSQTLPIITPLMQKMNLKEYVVSNKGTMVTLVWQMNDGNEATINQWITLVDTLRSAMPETHINEPEYGNASSVPRTMNIVIKQAL